MSDTLTLPVLPLRDTVIFPGVTVPIRAGRPGTLKAIQMAAETDEKLVFAVAQRSNTEAVSPESLFTIGTVARIGHLQQAQGVVQLLLEGRQRGIALRISEKDGVMEAIVREADEMPPADAEDSAFIALFRELRERAGELGRRAGFPEEIVSQVLAGVEEPGRMADLVASYLEIDAGDRQGLLETLSVEERLRRVLVHVQRQISVLKAQEDIKSKVQQELGAMGYTFQFITLAGFHALNASMFELARGYAEDGMTAYVKLQEHEFEMEADGYTATRHQREVGAGYFDQVAQVITGGAASTLAMHGSTEEEQF